MKKVIVCFLQFFLFLSFSVNAELFLWSSPEELENIPMSGSAWNKVLEAADQADGNDAFISDQEYNNNVQILAAAIVYARTGDQQYKDKVVTAIEKLVADGFMPAEPNTGRNDYNRSLAWGREAGAYVLAADLVDYRTPEFEGWCRDLAENREDSGNGWTLLYTFKHRPNNWGTHAFSTLVAIYAYLGDIDKLNEIYFDRLGGLTGIGKPAELSYGNLCWQYDENNPVMINPRGATKNGANIDGLAPDDMRRGNCTISDDPKTTNYAWEFLHGELSGTRVLNRLGYPIYQAADYAYQRAVTALQERLSSADSYWFAQGDDEPQLPFWDEAFGTNYSASYDPDNSKLYKSGKSFGWGYVTLGDKSKDLSVTTNGPGDGFVTLFPAGGIYPIGTQVTITATASSGSSFSGWSGAINSNDNPVTLSIDSAIQVTATFNDSDGGGGTGNSSGELAVSSVTASADDGNAPSNTLDKSLGTRWSADGEGQWIRYDLGSEQTVGSVYIAWYKGSSRVSTFDIDYSLDGDNWQNMLSGQSSGNTLELEEFDLTDTTARFVRITGHGNSSNSWNSITEVEIHGSSTAPQQFSISTTVSGTGNGIVAIEPAGSTFAAGTEITITAIPDTESTFDSWSGDLSGVSNQTTLIVDSAKQIIATFTSSDDGGTGNSSGELAVSSVTASANDGNEPTNTLDKSLGSRWSADGDGQWIRYDLGSEQTVSSVYIAWYKGDSRVYTFDIEYSLNGNVWQNMFSGQSGGSTRELEEFDLTDTTARFVRITGHGNSSNSWNSITEVEIHGSSTAPQQFSISTTVSGTGNGIVAIEPAGSTFAAGTEITITAIPDTESTFDSWSGDLSGVSNQTTLIVDSAKQIIATFTSSDDGGTGNSSGELAVSSVTASANDGNEPTNTLDKSLGSRWSADGDGQWIRYDLGSEQTVSSVYIAWYKGDSRVSTFDIEYSLNGNVWQNMFSGQSGGSTRELEEFDLTDTTARFVRITGHGNSSNSWNSITEVEIHGSATAPQQFSISTTVSGTGNGIVAIEPAGSTFVAGTEITITAIPDTESTFDSWSGDLSGVSNQTTLIVDSAKQIIATFTSSDDGGTGNSSGELAVSSVTASANDGNEPTNTLDKSLGSRWSADGDGQWIRYDLGSEQTVSSVYIAWYKGDSRVYTFDIEYSLNGNVWQNMFSGQSGGSTRELEEFDLTDTTARFVRITGHGNSSNSWNSITEVEIHGSSTAP